LRVRPMSAEVAAFLLGTVLSPPPFWPRLPRPAPVPRRIPRSLSGRARVVMGYRLGFFECGILAEFMDLIEFDLISVVFFIMASATTRR
jgi:hypothetical protein